MGHIRSAIGVLPAWTHRLYPGPRANTIYMPRQSTLEEIGYCYVTFKALAPANTASSSLARNATIHRPEAAMPLT